MKTNKKPKGYYNTKESFTMRTDIDPHLKWILTHMESKLKIPSEKLQDALVPGKYTFSVSGVSKCLGFPLTTTQDKLHVLEKIDIIRNIGTRNTTDGTVVLWDVNREKFKSLMSGKITLNKTTTKVSHIKRGGSTGPVEGSTSPVIRITSPVEGSTGPVTSTKMEYSNGSNQRQYSNGTNFIQSSSAQEPIECNPSRVLDSVGPVEQETITNDNSQSGQNTAGNGSDRLQEFNAVFGEPTTIHKPGDELKKNPSPSMAPGPEPDKVTNSSTVPGPGWNWDDLKESIKNSPDPTLEKWMEHQMGRI